MTQIANKADSKFRIRSLIQLSGAATSKTEFVHNIAMQPTGFGINLAL
jgi:hypothetical protein